MTSDASYGDLQYSRMLLALGAFIVFGIGIAVGAVFGDATRLLTWVLGFLALFWSLVRTRLEVVVDSFGIRVNRASIKWRFVQRVEVLEGDALRAATSTELHPRDFVRLRGTSAALRVWLDDQTDPHRAWLITVREPQRLRAVLVELGLLGERYDR